MIPELDVQLRKGVVEHCVLGALVREPMYGWQLADVLGRAGLIGGIGTLYPVLSRLRTRGLIVEFERDSVSGPVRKYYRVTEAGERELDRFRRQWGVLVDAVEAFTRPATPEEAR